MLRGTLLGGSLLAAALVAGGAQAARADTPAPINNVGFLRLCSAPGQDWERADPADVGLDPVKLDEALRFVDSRLSSSALVIRGGCLVGVSPNGQANYATPQESWSMAKSMVSMTALRAMTMGLLSPDDRLGALMPEADAAHGNITVRQLLEMSSGLRWNILADYNVWNPDVVRHGLLLGFDDPPGKLFEYHQTGTALMTKVIERAVGEPFQQFVQRELFGPIGIPRSAWTWLRDDQGNTRGFFGLDMPAQDFARLGFLMLREGSWNGRQLIDPWYVAAAHARSPTNPGYGWMFWRNDADGYISATVTARSVKTRPFLPPVPMDSYLMSGLFDQEVVIIPSLDTVYVRMGLPSSSPESGNLIDFIASSEGPYMMARKLMAAFVTPEVPDRGPWIPDSELPPATGSGRGLATSLQRIDEFFASAAVDKPPLPPRGPARARVPITPSGLLTVAADGWADLPVSCPPVGELPCRASFTVVSASGRPLSTAGRVTIERGRGATVRLRFSAAARARIAAGARGRLAARVVISVGDSARRWSSVAVPPITVAVQGS